MLYWCNLSFISIIILLIAVNVSAAPHGGEEFWLGQPDGSLVSVRVFGDEFHQDVESPDGYTLVRGADGWICYAELSADGSEYVSTGVRYTGSSRAPGPRKGLRISRNSVVSKQRKVREILGYDELITPRPSSRPLSKSQAAPDDVSPAPLTEPKVVVGLTLLIDFPDQKSNISRAALNDFCNRPGGVNGASAAGSVYDYFYDVSNGLLEYRNIVTPFVTVDSNKTHYDRGTNYQYVPELLASALSKLRGLGIDLSEITTEATGSGSNRREIALALNIFYAGSPTQGWANGIWPHSGTMRQTSSSTVNGVTFSSYQLSSLGTGGNPPGIGTFVHENGHMVLKWPDLYSYEDHSNGVGNWCVMNSTNGSNPQPPNPYLRDLAGWIEVTPLTDATSGVFTHVANSPTAYKYARNAKESYYIEARRRVGRSANIPGSGLAIWHIHADGKNTDPSRGFPIVALVQADGRNDLENRKNNGDAADLFRARYNASFNKLTNPAAVYYDRVSSNIDISEISDSGAVMTFRAGGGAGGPPTYYLTVANGSGGGYYEAGATAAIAAPEANAAGRAFIRWTSATLEPRDAYACSTTVATAAAEATVTALFARAFVLPGAVEADTFGYAQGITSASSSNGATGNRVARIVDTSKFAEYVVNVWGGGQYRLSYRLLTSSSSAGGFILRDVTNGVTLDSVAVPTSARASMQTVQGAAVTIPPGKAVWRIEPRGGNYSIDWFAAEETEPQTTAPVANNTGKPPFAYGVRAAPAGKVSFQIPTAGHVSLRMYDVRGRMVATLFDGTRGPGAYSVQIGGLSQGLYIIRMRSGGYAKDVKIHYRR